LNIYYGYDIKERKSQNLKYRKNAKAKAPLKKITTK